MINIGLSSAELKLFQRSLITGYNMKICVQILDLNHVYLGDVSGRLLGGQVNKSFEDKITNSATLSLLDPDNQVGFDTINPSEGALYADRMIRIVYSVFSPLLPKWVDVPLFLGPVTRVSRDEATLSVECQGKESLYLAPQMAWAPLKTFPKGQRLVTALRDLMANKGGETKFDLPEWTRTLKKDFSFLTETSIWDFAQTLVGSRTITRGGATYHSQGSAHLYYDGRGVLRLRDTPSSPIFTFTEDWITSVPKLVFDSSAIRNTVRVLGAVPTGKAQIWSNAHLPAADQSSSTSLGRKLANGTVVKRYLVELIEDSTIDTKAEADQLSSDTLASLDLQNINFDFDSFPTPHLEPGDVFLISTSDFARNLRVREISIPLRAGEAQTNGTFHLLTPTSRVKRK